MSWFPGRPLRKPFVHSFEAAAKPLAPSLPTSAKPFARSPVALLVPSLGALLSMTAIGCTEPREDTDTPSDAGLALVPQIARCATCHGDPGRAGDTLLRATPPRDTRGNTEPAALGVGVHLTHVAGTERSRPVACAECHEVPSDDDPLHHVEQPPTTRVVFSGVALANRAEPQYAEGRCAEVPCHGNQSRDGNAFGGSNPSPSWTASGTVADCTACHGVPPPAPHPQGTLICAGCHRDIAEDQHFLRPDLHVDGLLTFTLPAGAPDAGTPSSESDTGAM